jgi:muramoyltetrapeptide carboxypeptidase
MAQPLKPAALRPGDAIRVVSASSPVAEERVERGCEELARLGFVPKLDRATVLARDGFFAGAASDRLAALEEALGDAEARGIFFTRGGYGVNYLLDGGQIRAPAAKVVLGYSDLTTLQIFLWQRLGWVTFYGPMVASGFDRGAGVAEGYDLDSLMHAVTETQAGWTIHLSGEALAAGAEVDGILLGGCLTLIETTLGTPWELDTKGAILVMEDRGMKPWQVDRALMHLKHAGKLDAIRGVVLGDFPDCEAPAGSETVKDVARRLLGALGVPVVWGAAIGHTARPILTIPLGVRAVLSSEGEGALRIVDAACASE